ncbi:hypothetical protein J6590_045652 [Homalodisca vitripennis]|nr:hypothetical protein J6590_045652 [Homalodisca vitripennis]
MDYIINVSYNRVTTIRLNYLEEENKGNKKIQTYSKAAWSPGQALSLNRMQVPSTILERLNDAAAGAGAAEAQLRVHLRLTTIHNARD